MSFVFSSHAITLKVGILAPEGTNWANNLKKMAKEIDEQTAGEVKIKIYYGGVLGDEPVVLQKIRVGQVHGGIFTGKTLGELNGDVRIVEVPFTFKQDREKAWNTVEKMANFFNQGFEENGFINLGMFEIGQVYLVTQKKIEGLEALKGVKVWSWTGDPLANTLVEVLGLVSVPLSLPDVLSSLSTGIVEAAYSPPMAITALQWDTKIKYFVEYPITFSIGAFLVSDQYWKKISVANQKKTKDICAKHIALANTSTIQDNKDAITGMGMKGIEFINLKPEDIARSSDIRAKVIEKLTGTVFSKKAVEELDKLIK